MVRAVLFGGGGTTHGEDPGLEQFLMTCLPDKPCIGHLGAANDDNPDRIARVRQRFGDLGAQVAHLPANAGREDAAEWAAPLHAVYVSGGNTARLLMQWRMTGIDTVLMDAARRGVLLSGVSAGAVAWFDFALWDGNGAGYQPLAGLGLLSGSCCPHYTTEPARAQVYRDHVAGGLIPDGYAIGDGAGLVLDGATPARSMVARARSGVWRVQRSNGTAQETVLETIDAAP